MPPYRAGRYARNDNPAEYKRWESQYGPDFLHTHHLCDGIGLLNNYHKARTAQERKGLLNEAMGNLKSYAGNEDKVTSGPGSAESSADVEKQPPRTPRSAVFDLSRNTGSARKEAPIVNAGAYLLVEVKEDLSVPELVHLRIQSQIPQPAARIPSVALDTGRFSGLIATLEVKDPLLGNYYPLRSTGGSHGHAYWPSDFTPDYVARFTIDPKAGKMYDPRSLAPGSSLNLVVRLSPGGRFEDVVEAMKLGLKSPDGVRIGVIAHHLMGYRPDSSKTIMDDAGFLSGSLRQLSGFADEQKPSSAPVQRGDASAQSVAREAEAGDTRTPAGQGQASTPVATGEVKPGIGTPSNPWCRFCPEPSAK